MPNPIYTGNPDAVEEGLQRVYNEIRDSFELALNMQFLSNVEEVLTTVDDAVSNHWDDLVAAFYGEVDGQG